MSRGTTSRIRRLLVVAVATMAGIEVLCRFGLGLGHPPLLVRDPHCGYRFAPSQSVRRFGNNVSYDHLSRRGEWPEGDSGKSLEIMLVGDSVLNGGTLTDDADTADAVLNSMAVLVGGKRAVFRNLSAGSWAPPQQLAYLKAYGVGNAQSLILVLSSHDALGRHTGAAPPFPSQKPWLAAEELVWRYILQQRRHLFDQPHGWEAMAADVPTEIADSPEQCAIASWCLAEICKYSANRNLPMAVVLWPTRLEAKANAWDPICESIKGVLAEYQVGWIDLLPTVRQQTDFAGLMYRDDIHPTVAGQRLLAGAVLQATLQLFAPTPH